MTRNYFKELKHHFKVLYSLSTGEGSGRGQTTNKHLTNIKNKMKKTIFKKKQNHEKI